MPERSSARHEPPAYAPEAGSEARSIAALIAAQRPSGAFGSSVGDGEARVEDETCFVTAQVALALSDLIDAGAPDRRGLMAARERALDFLEICADAADRFSFYPPTATTPRLPIALTPDADDTALALLALRRGGRTLQRTSLIEVFEPLRVDIRRRGDQAFVRAGCWRTWFDTPDQENPVDVIVNINILAVLAVTGCLDDSAAAAAGMVNAACRATDGSTAFLRRLAPYYASAAELEIALDRAVILGVEALRPAQVAIRRFGHLKADRIAQRPPDRALYCNAHGRPLWRAPALQYARRLTDLFSRIPTHRPPDPTVPLNPGEFHDAYA